MKKERGSEGRAGAEGDQRASGDRRVGSTTWDEPERRDGEERRVGGSRRSGGVPRSERTQSRMAVSLPTELINDIEQLAQQDVRSINGEIIVLLREAVDARKAQ